MRDVAIVGVGMTRFGKFLDKSIKDLAHEAVKEALEDAGIDKTDIEAAYVGNAVAGLITGQEMIRGQVTLSTMGIDGIPIYNVENACGSSSAAFNLGWTAVGAGVIDCALIVGFEKLYHQDKIRSFKALATGCDIDNYMDYFKKAEEYFASKGEKLLQEGGGESRSIFMDMYAFLTRQAMKNFGLTQEHFAKISVKAHKNGAMNSHAQYQKEVSIEEVLNSGDIVYPLTRMMCAPIGDGAAAAVICSKSKAAQLTTKPIWVAASQTISGTINIEDDSTARRIAEKTYNAAGIGPKDIDVIELHDATSPSEITTLIELGICPGEDSPKWIEEGYLEIDGKMPTNTSGGLVTKGHPLGATGCGMIYEITKQLRGEAGKRQVKDPQVGMTSNGGGILGIDPAFVGLHILKK